MLDLGGPIGGELFVVVQLPFADLRSLIGPASGRLDRPSWPMVEPRVDFVRSFGQICPRMRGGVAEWAGEEAFCRANSAVRFPNELRKLQLGVAPLSANIDRVFRRFNSDGTVARFEACLQLAFPEKETAANEVPPLSDKHVDQLLQQCAELPSRIRGANGEWQTLPLIGGASLLARHYLRATTARKSAVTPQPWWFSCGSPTMLVESVQPQRLPLPRSAQLILQTGNVSVFHTWRKHGTAQFGVWFLQSQTPDKDVLRRLRIHLLRLHAERECLRQVITLILRRTFEYSASVESSDLTQQYLNDAIRAVERGERGGFDQPTLLDAARQAVEGAFPGANTTLLQMRRQIAEKVRRFIEQSEREHMNNGIQIGNISVTGDFNVVTAQNIQDSFNKASAPGVADTLKEKLQALTVEVGKLAAQLPPEEAEKVSRDLQTLATEVTSKSPRKAWYELSGQGLIDAAKTVAAMAGPITKAVKAVLSVLAG
jgi:hypothetical protein